MQRKLTDSIVELDYAGEEAANRQSSLTLRRLIRFSVFSLLFLHLALCIGIADLHYRSRQRAGFILAPGTTLSCIPYQILCFFRFSWYPLAMGALLDACAIIAMFFPSDIHKGRRMKTAAATICGTAIVSLAACVAVLQAYSPIAIVSTNTGGTLIANTTEYAILSCLVAGPAALWLARLITAAIRSQPPAPSPAPESSRDSSS